LGFGAELSHLIGGDEAEVHQDIYQIVVFFSHGSLSTKHVRREELTERVLAPIFIVNALERLNAGFGMGCLQ